MRDYSELELVAKAAVGFSDVSLAPDVVLELIAENKRMREDACFRAVKSLRADCKDLMAERDQLKAKTETYCTYGAEGSEHTFYGDQAAIKALGEMIFELEALREGEKS